MRKSTKSVNEISESDDEGRVAKSKDDFIRHRRISAMAGNRQAAENLLIQYLEDFENGDDIHPEVKKYLALSIKRFLREGLPISEAFLLKRSKGRPKDSGGDLLVIATSYYELLSSEPSIKKTDAKGRVAAKHKTSSRNVEKAIKKFPDMKDWKDYEGVLRPSDLLPLK